MFIYIVYLSAYLHKHNKYQFGIIGYFYKITMLVLEPKRNYSLHRSRRIILWFFSQMECRA